MIKGIAETKGQGAPEGNRNRETHGGEHAVKAIQRGEAFRGLAAREEQAVKHDLADQGRAALVEENAIRLQVASRLYWRAVQAAADDGDLEKLDSYVARFGWLAGASLRAWAEVRQERERAGQDDGVIDYERLLEAQSEHTED